MRFTRNNQKRSEFEVVVTSMLDINFLLIMFFMVTAHYQRETHATLDLPKEQGEKEKAEEDAGLVINLTADGAIIVSGKTIELAEVKQLVRAEVDRRPQAASGAADADGQGVALLVRADQHATSDQLNKVVSMLRELGVGAIRIATEIPGLLLP